jgi:hypothetical protein
MIARVQPKHQLPSRLLQRWKWMHLNRMQVTPVMRHQQTIMKRKIANEVSTGDKSIRVKQLSHIPFRCKEGEPTPSSALPASKRK